MNAQLQITNSNLIANKKPNVEKIIKRPLVIQSKINAEIIETL